VSRAKFKGLYYTPEQFKKKLELQNQSKKQTGEKLYCYDNCQLIFKKECVYRNSNGTLVVRSAHFAHKSNANESTCSYLQKYKYTGGETKEHQNTKMNIAFGNNAVFVQTCQDPDCKNTKQFQLDASWNAHVEYRVHRWLMDVAFVDKTTNDIKAIIEVKHSHAVDGVKRTWLLKQPFQYYEVKSNLTNTNYYQVIDSKGRHFCKPMQEDNTPCCRIGFCKRQETKAKELQKKMDAISEARKYNESRVQEGFSQVCCSYCIYNNCACACHYIQCCYNFPRQSRCVRTNKKQLCSYCKRKRNLLNYISYTVRWPNCPICKEAAYFNGDQPSLKCLCIRTPEEFLCIPDLRLQALNFKMPPEQAWLWEDCLQVKETQKQQIEDLVEANRKQAIKLQREKTEATRLENEKRLQSGKQQICCHACQNKKLEKCVCDCHDIKCCYDFPKKSRCLMSKEKQLFCTYCKQQYYKKAAYTKKVVHWGQCIICQNKKYFTTNQGTIRCLCLREAKEFLNIDSLVLENPCDSDIQSFFWKDCLDVKNKHKIKITNEIAKKETQRKQSKQRQTDQQQKIQHAMHHQKQINKNRKSFGLKKIKIQKNINHFFS
jgi:hypothetical protein